MKDETSNSRGLMTEGTTDNMVNLEGTVELKPYYVYELIDPLNNDIFYVGKGQGERAHQHEMEALTTENQTEKLRRIRKIQDHGKKVKVRVIGRYKTEKEAFAVEATLIHWMYDFDNLTNCVQGHGANSIREKGNNGVIAGIDIPERQQRNNGECSQEYIQARDRYGVVSSMKKMKEYLEMNSDFKFSDIDTTHAQYTTIFFLKNGVKLVVGKYNSSSNYFWIEVASINGKQSNKERVVELCENSPWEVKNNGYYAKLPGYGNKIVEPEQVLEHMLAYYQELQKK